MRDPEIIHCFPSFFHYIYFGLAPFYFMGIQVMPPNLWPCNAQDGRVGFIDFGIVGWAFCFKMQMEQGSVDVLFWVDFQDHLKKYLFVGDYIPSSWVMFN